MNATMTERLERLRNCSSAYEVVATHPDGRSVLVCYLCTLSKRGLFEAIRSRGPRLIASLGLPDDVSAILGGVAKRPTAIVGAWSIRLSGRTQRDAIVSGAELPYLPIAS